jgi:uncharacterized membrane-anchored protein YhcB (DUF1043 family)
MKTKSYLLIAATLIIGMIIGFLANGYITRQKFQKFVHQSGEQIFKKRMIDILRPHPLQFKEIEPILDKYDLIAQQNFQESRERMRKMHEEMIRELEKHLNNEQLEILKMWDERHREMRRIYGRPPDCKKPDKIIRRE